MGVRHSSTSFYCAALRWCRRTGQQTSSMLRAANPAWHGEMGWLLNWDGSWRPKQLVVKKWLQWLNAPGPMAPARSLIRASVDTTIGGVSPSSLHSPGVQDG